jgi:tripartite-type tricarboxylate transporter receptor subunit TctC
MRLGSRSIAAVALVFIVAALAAGATNADTKWPSRPVHFLVTLGAGSGADIGARLFADRLSRRWGEPVVVEDRPGADGLLAINAFVTAHDDHVLLFSPAASFTAHPYLHSNLPYKPSDLAPIAQVSNTIVAVAVPADLKVNSLKELVALARSEPGKLNWAGVTGALDFMFAGWLNSEGLNISKVPYRNPVDAAKDLGEGRVQVYEASLAIVQPELAAGKIKLLAVTNTARAPAEPAIPTVQEAGYPALTLDGLVGLFGPPGMPLELRRHISADVAAVADATIKDRLTVTGQVLNVGGPEQFAKSIDDQRAKVATFAKELGIKPLQ